MAARFPVCGSCQERSNSIRSRSGRRFSCADYRRVCFFCSFQGYDIRFPTGWPFRPTFVGLAVVALLAVRMFHFVSPRWTAADFSTRIRQIKNIVSADALPYLLLAAIIGLGFAFRYNDFGAMSFDHDEYGLIQKSKGVLELGFPFNRVAGKIKPATTYELVTYPKAVASCFLAIQNGRCDFPLSSWAHCALGWSRLWVGGFSTGEQA